MSQLISKLIIIKNDLLLIITILEIKLHKQMNTTTSTISTFAIVSICNLFIFVTDLMPFR